MKTLVLGSILLSFANLAQAETKTPFIRFATLIEMSESALDVVSEKNLAAESLDGVTPVAFIFTETSLVASAFTDENTGPRTLCFEMVDVSTDPCGSQVFYAVEQRGFSFLDDLGVQLKLVDHSSRICTDQIEQVWEVTLSDPAGAVRKFVGNPKDVHTFTDGA